MSANENKKEEEKINEINIDQKPIETLKDSLKKENISEIKIKNNLYKIIQIRFPGRLKVIKMIIIKNKKKYLLILLIIKKNQNLTKKKKKSKICLLIMKIINIKIKKEKMV